MEFDFNKTNSERKTLSIIFILIANLSYASFPICNSYKTISDQNEIFGQYQYELMNQASYTTQSFNKADRFNKKRFLPNWKLWQKVLLITFGLIVALIILLIIGHQIVLLCGGLSFN